MALARKPQGGQGTLDCRAQSLWAAPALKFILSESLISGI